MKPIHRNLLAGLAAAAFTTITFGQSPAENPATPPPPHEKQAPAVEQNLKVFDTLDFDVFSNQKWDGLSRRSGPRRNRRALAPKHRSRHGPSGLARPNRRSLAWELGGQMTNQDLSAYAALLLRVSLAVMFYAHAWLKIKVFTPAGTAKYFESLGVPGFLAYLTIAAEIGGGTLLLLGIETRWIALLLVPLIAGTIVLVHGKNGWLFSNKDGGWEYPAFWIVGLVVLSLLGDGSLALGPVLRLL